MFRTLRNNQGQGYAVQYVLTFFLVVGMIAAMSLYVRRVIQGRISDTVLSMGGIINQAYHNPSANIAGNSFTLQYEPYYGNVDSLRQQDSTDTHIEGQKVSGGAVVDQQFTRDYADQTASSTNSTQVSPRLAK